MTSNAFSSFYESYFGDPYMAWHDGLDVDSLLSLRGDELAEAERLLIERLKTGDYRPAAGLAALRSKAAAPALQELLPRARGNALVQTALALWQIEKYPPAVAALIGALRDSPYWSTRLDAAMALAHVRTPETVAALKAALNDPERLVRYHAASSLLTLHGLKDRQPPNELSVDVMSDNHRKRQRAVTDIERLIAEQGHLADEEPLAAG